MKDDEDWKLDPFSVKEGFLTKQSGVVNLVWRVRYFVLTRDYLSYFREKNRDEPARWKIFLHDAKLQLEPDDAFNKAFTFSIIQNNRKYTIAASSKEEMEGWVNTLKQTINNESVERKSVVMTIEDEKAKLENKDKGIQGSNREKATNQKSKGDNEGSDSENETTSDNNNKGEDDTGDSNDVINFENNNDNGF